MSTIYAIDRVQDMATILLSRNKTAPTWVSGKAKSVWKTSQEVITPSSALNMDEIKEKAGSADTVFIEDMSMLAELAPKLVDWDRVWKVVEELVAQEVTVYFIKEDIQISSVYDDAYVTMAAVATAIDKIRSLKLDKIHRSQLKQAKAEGSKMNWIIPDKAVISGLVSDVEKLGIQAGCKKSGISRQTYYNWKKKGYI